jgi:L-seryl-tRNA(Ser) seleniumtransferase
VREIPTLRMLTTPQAGLRRRAEAFAARLRAVPGVTVEVRDDVAYVGGGSLPDVAVPTSVVAVSVDGAGEGEVAARLRAGTPAVVARVADGRVLLDLRAVFEREEDGLLRAVTSAAGRG